MKVKKIRDEPTDIKYDDLHIQAGISLSIRHGFSKFSRDFRCRLMELAMQESGEAEEFFEMSSRKEQNRG